MSRLSRDKGARSEREIVTAHKALGIRAEKVPLSGATRYMGNGSDVDVYAFGPGGAPLVCEVKATRERRGFCDPGALARRERCPLSCAATGRSRSWWFHGVSGRGLSA
jgi:Holliday junction resolvase